MSKHWWPSSYSGDYKLAPSVAERLFVRLKSFRNRDALAKLSIWLIRMNASPKRLGRAFPIDRRALAKRSDIGLTEAAVRGCIKTLISIGLIEVVPSKTDARYQRIEGGVRRLPIQYQFSFEFRKIFLYLIGRFSKSPKGRLDSKSLEDTRGEAPLLGEKTGSKRDDPDLFTVARNRVNQKRRVDGLQEPHRCPSAVKKAFMGVMRPEVVDDALRAALSRLERAMGKGVGKETAGLCPPL